MTGFGKAQSQFKQMDISIELRSVNNRFQEIFVRLPKHYQTLEHDIRERIQKQIKRGKINAYIQISENGQQLKHLSLNKELVASYKGLLGELKSAAELSEELSLSHFLSLDGIFLQDDDDADQVEFKNALLKCVDDAVADLNAMRKAEGAELVGDLSSRNNTIRSVVAEVEKLNETTAQDEFTKLKTRVHELIEQTEVSSERLEAELSLIADRSDITEECVRLKSHTQLFDDELKKEAPGKRLNFLLQEMNREVNTIGSKTPNVAISHIVVSAKEEIEKIREQVQNIE